MLYEIQQRTAWDCGLPLWGARGSVFESHRPDQTNQRLTT